MIIGIDASRAFLKRRTGIEEYGYQVIRHLRSAIPDTDRVILYVRPEQRADFDLPRNWRVKTLRSVRLWTQARLSWEMLLHPTDVLFVPAHIVPLIHPRRTVVTVHGLEYEFCPEAYPVAARWYMRILIRLSCRWAHQVIAVSENTKRDLIRLYGVPEGKITVISEGVIPNRIPVARRSVSDRKYLLFVGRLEERKNVVRMVEAFEILKRRHRVAHELVLAGKPGYGYEKIRSKIRTSDYGGQIRELGYVSETEKWELLSGADVFLFPTLYEGFGLPVIEAQMAGSPVLASSMSSLPEIGGDGAVYADPFSSEDIAEKAWMLISDPEMSDDIIKKGRKNAKRFDWGECARRIAVLLKR